MLQQKTRTRAHFHIPRDQHRAHSSVGDSVATKDRFFKLSVGSGPGAAVRTTAVTFVSLSCRFAIPGVSRFLRSTAGPRGAAPSPFLRGARCWSPDVPEEKSPMLVASVARYRFRGLNWSTAESTGGGGTDKMFGEALCAPGRTEATTMPSRCSRLSHPRVVDNHTKSVSVHVVGDHFALPELRPWPVGKLCFPQTAATG